MGITKLHAHLKPLSRDVDVAAYAGCSVGVDASAWLHRAYHGAACSTIPYLLPWPHVR